jgi:DNA-binding response OmpR family regulator
LKSQIDENPIETQLAMAKILVVDDDEPLVNILTDILRFEHYSIETAINGVDGMNMLSTNAYDVAIIDWDMPDLTGVEICKTHRAKGGRTSILMLTAKSKTISKVEGFESGADDYLTKPFEPDELKVRIKALLRRPTQFAGNELVLGSITLEPTNFRVTKDGCEIRLIRKEFVILELLMRYPGKVFSLSEIIDRVWSMDESPSQDVVRAHISNLRKKLDNNIIKTIHGVGYKAEV